MAALSRRIQYVPYRRGRRCWLAVCDSVPTGFFDRVTRGAKPPPDLWPGEPSLVDDWMPAATVSRVVDD
jgi:hypothetical protein